MIGTVDVESLRFRFFIITVFSGLRLAACDIECLRCTLVQYSPTPTRLRQILFSAAGMAAAVNKSFTSPAANAEYPVALHDVAGGLLARVFSGVSGVSGTGMVITLLLLLVAYDQCLLSLSSGPIVTDHKFSQIYME